MTQSSIIVEHAMKMFVTHGVKAVRMDDIAQSLSISKRTIYEMFGDKEELLYQSIMLYSAQGHERRKQQTAALDNDLEIMIVCLRDMINSAPVVRRIRRNLHRFYPAVFKRVEKELQAESHKGLSEWIRCCVNKGYFTSTADCDFVIRVLNDSTRGILGNEIYDEYDSSEVIALMSYSLVIFIRGLCTAQGMEIIDNCFNKYFGNIRA